MFHTLVFVSLLLIVNALPRYIVRSVSPTSCGFNAVLSLSHPSTIHGEPLEQTLFASLSCHSASNLRFTVRSSVDRWIVPDVVQPSSPAPAHDLHVTLPRVNYPFAFSVHRHQEELFSFNSSLLMTEHYLELTGSLPPALVITGLGYRKHPLFLKRSEKYGFWNRDEPGLPPQRPAYSTHPLLLASAPFHSSRGFFFLNSNAMEVELTLDSFVFRSSGGIIDLFLYSGPSPSDVINQHQEVVGSPVAIPIFALGWMQARWGWKTIDDVIGVVDDYDRDQIPLDVLFFDIDYMQKYYDFTVDPDRYPLKKLSKFIKILKSRGVSIIPIVDPGIPIDSKYFGYSELLKSKAFLTQRNSSQPQEGTVWPGRTIFPDFSHPNALPYWRSMLSSFLQSFDFDGLWIDMNEPASFVTEDHPVIDFDWNNPPWKPSFSVNQN
ncbi:hypothetical protein GEMRC1_011549 [Eukaryota sp. GEM-RC1]